MFALAKGLLSTARVFTGRQDPTNNCEEDQFFRVIDSLMSRDMTARDLCHTTVINNRVMYVSYLRLVVRLSIIITFLHFGDERVQERDDFMESLTEGRREEN